VTTGTRPAQRAGDAFAKALASRPFEPIAERSGYHPPTATIDPDRSKSWVGRVRPLVRSD
jgi:hypothetical protein